MAAPIPRDPSVVWVCVLLLVLLVGGLLGAVDSYRRELDCTCKESK